MWSHGRKRDSELKRVDVVTLCVSSREEDGDLNRITFCQTFVITENGI